jgi:uncharacterized protein (DUF1499 family)
MSAKAKYVPLVALGLAGLAALAVLLAGPGSRFGPWHWRTGFTIVQYGAYAGLAAAVLAAVGGGLVRMRAGWKMLGASVAALLIGLGSVGVPWTYKHKAASLPRIHDITTDTENPPGMIALLKHRHGAQNLPMYAGRVVADRQRKGYPDIAPVTLPVPPNQAYDRVRAAAKRLGWTVVASVAPEKKQDGRLEAYERSLLFGFTDDIVVRIRPAPGGSRIDIRSVSRMGEHDHGANAERIRKFSAAMRG